MPTDDETPAPGAPGAPGAIGAPGAPPAPGAPAAPGTPGADTRRAQPAPRGEVEDALRFVHVMAMQGRLATERVEAMLTALLEALERSGHITEDQIRAHLEAAQARARARATDEAHVAVAPAEGKHADKYAIDELPDIDCPSLLPICKGRCCRLLFPLSFQDLDEGVVEWNYRRPYVIRQRERDGYCVHNHAGARTCTIYEHRPGICRVYDCRNDSRIWIDFENRVPAPPEAVRDQPVLIERIGVGKPARST